MLRRLEQLLHLVVDSHHVGVGLFDSIAKLVEQLVLVCELSLRVLGLVLGGLHHVDDFTELLVLPLDLVFLDLDDAAVVEVTRLIVLTILASHQPLRLHVSIGLS